MILQGRQNKPAGGRRTGRYWEEVAGRHLETQGLRILLRGYQCRLGELDLVCDHGGILVVVEVKARSRSRFATARSSVDLRKQHKIIMTTRHLLMSHPEWVTKRVRFDVIAIEDIDSGRPALDWIQNAFDTTP